MILTTENYHSVEANREYMSCHQLTAWIDCPAREAATQAGEWEDPEKKQCFLEGNYADAALTLGDGALDEFKAANADRIFKKSGTDKGGLYAPFAKMDIVIARMKRDPLAMALLTGEPQVIITYDLGGVRWRSCIDVLNLPAEMFTDLKTAKSMLLQWVDIIAANGRIKGQKAPWYEEYQYWRQMAVYQHGIHEVFGKWCLPVIVGGTKEKEPRLEAVRFENTDRLRREIDEVLTLLPVVMAWKRGDIKPPMCEECDYCKPRMEMREVQAESVVVNRAMPRYWRESDPIGQMIEEGQM